MGTTTMLKLHLRSPIRTFSIILSLLAMTTIATAEPLLLSTQGLDTAGEMQTINFSSDRTTLAATPAANSFEQHRFSDNLRVRGWQVAQNLYFGQAKVADKWGIGLLLKKDSIVYGVNHRGLQITRQF